MHPSLPTLTNIPHPTLNQLPNQNRGESAHASGNTPPPIEEVAASPPHSAYQQKVEFQQSGSTSLQIQTQDGDSITLQMQSQWQVAMGYSETNTATSQSQQSILQHDQGYAIHYQVEGELDQEELDALDGVMQQLSVTAQHFFGGDLAGAVDSLEDFQIDSEVFALISMTMQRSVSYSMAEQYREIGEMSPASLPTYGTTGGLTGLASFTQNLFQMMDAVNEELERILMPEQFVSTLMEQAIYRDPRSSELPESLLTKVEYFLSEMATQWNTINNSAASDRVLEQL